jgi:hypothetical protein
LKKQKQNKNLIERAKVADNLFAVFELNHDLFVDKVDERGTHCVLRVSFVIHFVDCTQTPTRKKVEKSRNQIQKSQTAKLDKKFKTAKRADKSSAQARPVYKNVNAPNQVCPQNSNEVELVSENQSAIFCRLFKYDFFHRAVEFHDSPSHLKRKMAFRLLLLLACCSLAVHAMPTIRHVVVLVMENRAFGTLFLSLLNLWFDIISCWFRSDHFVGMKSTANPLIDGCRLGTTDPTCGNRYNPLNSSEPYIFVGNKAVFVQPADPGHSVPDTAEQLFGDTQTHPVDAVPPMDGFVQSYSKFNHQSSGGAFIMQCFDPVHVPVLSQLIDEYALFNAWHASIPGPTMVNRAYFDSATSYGKTDNDLLQIILGYPQRTIFQDLDENGASWKVYFQLFATSWQMAYSRAKLSVCQFNIPSSFLHHSFIILCHSFHAF